jgi:hypothetical protein
MELAKREAGGKAMSGNSCNSHKYKTSLLVIATQKKAKATQNKAKTARLIKEKTHRKCLRKSKRGVRPRYSLEDIIACIYR